MEHLICPAEADTLIAAALSPLATESVALEKADRRILRTPLRADRPLPPYDRVMMDGICFRAAEAGASGDRLLVHGLHAAGDPAPRALPRGRCWEIMTGAQLPPDCDTVAPYELIRRDGQDAVLTEPAPRPGTHIHAAGSDFPDGAELVPVGTPVTSRVAAVAATVGAIRLEVTRLPHITVLTTGDELVPPEQVPEPHQVRRSNDVALRAALHAWGPCEVRLAHLPDSADALTSALRIAIDDADFILTCGGISKGQRDFIRPVLESLLGPPLFHGIAQRPGKPLAFWGGDVPVFALPGNPMSALICFHRYVLPAIDQLSGLTRNPQVAPLADEVTFKPHLAYFLPVLLTPDLRALPRPLQNSGDFASAIDSTGFLELPAKESSFPPASLHPYIPWL